VKFALISTTINVPHILKEWRATLDDVSEGNIIIVTGDLKSPHEQIEAFMSDLPGQHVANIYLRPEEQGNWASSDVISWNCIQRRNIALLEAMRLKPDYIITVDDDNAPDGREHMEQIRQYFEGGIYPSDILVTSEDGWWNPCSQLEPQTTHRGYPLNRRHTWDTQGIHYQDGTKVADIKIGVHASFWSGEPDIDAIERMVNAPIIEADQQLGFSAALDIGTWAPFNSQATTFRAQLAPLMMVWPGCGRYDDIWASYLARKVMDHFGFHVVYGHPFVHQDRNPHNLMTDLYAELYGMEHTPALVEALRQIDLDGSETIMHAMARVMGYVSLLPFISAQTTNSFRAWIADVEKAMGK
jgi:hypothetical protein